MQGGAGGDANGGAANPGPAAQQQPGAGAAQQPAAMIPIFMSAVHEVQNGGGQGNGQLPVQAGGMPIGRITRNWLSMVSREAFIRGICLLWADIHRVPRNYNIENKTLDNAWSCGNLRYYNRAYVQMFPSEMPWADVVNNLGLISAVEVDHLPPPFPHQLPPPPFPPQPQPPAQ